MKLEAPSKGIALAVIATAAGIGLLYFLRPVLIPLILAFVLAVLVNALVRFIGKRSPKAPRWAVLLLAGVIVVVAAAAAFVVIAQGAANMVREAPRLMARMDELVFDAGQALHLHKPLSLATLIGNLSVPQIAGTAAGSVGQLFSGLVLMITYFGFILAGRERVNRKIASLGRLSRKPMPIEEAVSYISARIETYVWVHTVTGTIVASASCAVMLAVGLHNALFWAVMILLLSFIPMIGVTIGSIVPALFALVQFPNWWQAAVIFAGIQAAAGIVGNLIYPRLQAQTQNIDPVATLFALAFWGYLWGLTGAFLAVPLTTIVMMVCGYFPQTRWLAIVLSNDGSPVFATSSPKKLSPEI